MLKKQSKYFISFLKKIKIYCQNQAKIKQNKILDLGWFLIMNDFIGLHFSKIDKIYFGLKLELIRFCNKKKTEKEKYFLEKD